MTTYIPSLTFPAVVFEHPAASILLPIAAGTAVGFSSRPKQVQNTYLALRQPPLRPPPWIFGPVWTLLYGLMGYSAYRAWNAGLTSLDAKKVLLAKVNKDPPSPQPPNAVQASDDADSRSVHSKERLSTPSNSV